MTLSFTYSVGNRQLAILCATIISGALSPALSMDLPREQMQVFQKIHSLSYEAEVIDKLSPSFGEKTGASENQLTMKGRLSYASKDGLYVWDIRAEDARGQLEIHDKTAFDGSRYQLFDKRSKSLSLKSGPRKSHPTLMGSNVFFEPFAFLAMGRGSDPAFVLMLPDLKSDERWKQVADAAKYLGLKEVAGLATHLFSIPGATDPLRKLKFDYQVYFAPELGHYPVRWERVSREGKVIARYEARRLGVAKDVDDVAVRYPEVGLMEQFAEGEVLHTVQSKVFDVKLNAIVETDIFTIDPSLASTIFDADRKIQIETDSTQDYEFESPSDSDTTDSASP